MLAPQQLLSGFNTQPPEGGWDRRQHRSEKQTGFNTQPPEGGWQVPPLQYPQLYVSTHSRLKAAGIARSGYLNVSGVSTHSRLKAAGHGSSMAHWRSYVSTHSRLKAAGKLQIRGLNVGLCFNTQPPEGGWGCVFYPTPCHVAFQHTAA